MQAQKPLYQLPLHKSRILIPKTISLVILSTLFFLAILGNISLLDLDKSTEGIIKFSAAGIIFLLIILGIFLNSNKVKHGVKFFSDHLEIGHRKIKYITIPELERKQNFLDKKFDTYTLQLGKKLKIDAIPISVDLHSYLQRLISYNKAQVTQGMSEY